MLFDLTIGTGSSATPLLGCGWVVVLMLGVGWFRGGRSQFEKDVDPHMPMLYRVARRLAANHEEAEDLVSQTILKAYKGYASFDGTHLRSWLIRILRNEAGLLRRSAAARVELVFEEQEALADNDTWQEVHWRASYDRILEEISRLPEEYRIAIQLCDIEELSYEEAAAAAEVPLGTIRSRLFRARRLVRGKLGSLVLEDPAQ